MNPQANSSREQAVEDLKKTNHRVAHGIASKMVNAFRTFIGGISKDKVSTLPTVPNFFTFNRETIEEILAKPGCVGLRIYPAIKEVDGKETFSVVLTAVDGKYNNIVSRDLDGDLMQKTASASGGIGGSGAYDEVQTCPPYPKPEDDF